MLSYMIKIKGKKMKKVVFVDDSKTVLLTAQMALQNLVKEKKLELKTYDNPLNFISDVEDGFVYDLLITDINMPQMSGLEMVKKLQQNPNVDLKPILVLTTETSMEKKKEARKLGISGWVTKPFTPDKLLMAVKRVLRV